VFGVSIARDRAVQRGVAAGMYAGIEGGCSEVRGKDGDIHAGIEAVQKVELGQAGHDD
jgi:hypothetical protein